MILARARRAQPFSVELKDYYICYLLKTDVRTRYMNNAYLGYYCGPRLPVTQHDLQNSQAYQRIVPLIAAHRRSILGTWVPGCWISLWLTGKPLKQW